MRNRHFPRLCHSCQGPMGAQEDTCWRCGVTWTPEPHAALRVIVGGAAPQAKAASPQPNGSPGSSRKHAREAGSGRRDRPPAPAPRLFLTSLPGPPL